MSQELHTTVTQTQKAQQQPAVAAFDANGDNKAQAMNVEHEAAPSNDGICNVVNGFWAKERKGAIQEAPAFLVNHSSNFIGAAHVATEMMMFKASSKDAKLIQNPKNPVNWIKEPIVTVFSDTFKRSRSEIPVKDLLTKGNPITNIYKRVTDVNAATERARKPYLDKGVPINNIKLSNPWQTRSTLSGLVAWSLGALIPENKEDPAELERMAIKSRTNPAGYVLERLKQAVWFPEWADNKRQMIGLSYLVSGVCSTIGAWRNRDNSKLPVKYAFNGGYMATSLLTMASSLPLLFASDNQRGYGMFGNIMMGRLVFLPKSIHQRFKNNEPGKEWYTAATLSFQAENVAQSLIGGAEKLPDGTIVDHDEIRKSAKAKAEAIIKARRKGGKLEEDASVPETKVDSVKHMERVEERAEERVAG